MLGLQSYSDFAGVSYAIETEGCIVSNSGCRVIIIRLIQERQERRR